MRRISPTTHLFVKKIIHTKKLNHQSSSFEKAKDVYICIICYMY